MAIADQVALVMTFWVSAYVTGLYECSIGRAVELVSSSCHALYITLLSCATGVWFWTKVRHYSDRKPFWSELREICLVLIVAASIELAVAALSKWGLSRLHWSTSWILAVFALPLMRAATRQLLTRMGTWNKRTLIIGCGDNAHGARLALRCEALLGFDVVAYIAPSSAAASTALGAPVLRGQTPGTLDVAPGTQIVIALDPGEQDLHDAWVRGLSHRYVRDICVIPAMRGVPLHGTDISYFYRHGVAMLQVRNNLARSSAQLLKRLVDIVGASIIAVALLPLMLVICVCVAADRGAIVFGHQRVGQSGRWFKCYKFRSMVPNAEAELRKMLKNDPVVRAEWARDFKLKNDVRITKVGRFLRRTSLDELPQLWNVLRGDMSLVGPRPIVEQELERYDADVDYYLMTKPGMTGLWQVSGRNDADYATRVYLDAWYVKNWSLWCDLAILFKTVGVVLDRKGAY
ncbi:undecaprenyl-phosphate galactose phosphotransferase WbaP [Paraburkholderia sediminicola]|uniref:undecaprenyl-phosphate galactose phosphotransferase WbaP n=1 Tax=Paraburkholderia sediminicola TaxID=458836 RepID=UPI0038B6D78E